ncbi:ABC transporter ATP-binding protein/permease [Nocardioides sp. cx-169]|uniref:ABC transporter transmembrane domain-containing protein n=1 Tax=Nocardioides sp. cx-169 TaxID=2899080 RepID=UPI001E542C43|nr:ABC transporter ATP-binding protein [Nocardioides sp. cx-169]MCD4532822.1 ABC transporter ATP-binding protein/permease [Nocardioides sp. cx-169]
MPEPHTDRVATAGALLRRAVTRNVRPLAGAIALITVWQVCESLVPVLIGVLIDRAVATGDVSELVLWSLALCALFAVLSYSYRFGSRLGFGALQREGHRLRTEVSGRVLDARGARTERLPGDLLSIATADADMAAGVLRQLVYSTAAVFGLAVSAVILAVIDPLLAVVVLLGVPAVLGVTQLLSAPLARRSEARQAALGTATGVAADLVRGLRPLKGIGAEGAAVDRFRTASRQAARASVAAARWEGAMYGLTRWLSGLFLVVVALIASHRALSGDIGIGELIAVVGLAQFVAEPIALLSYMVAQVAQSRASAGRIVEFLAAPPLVHEGDDTTTDGSTLVLDRIQHGPLRDVSLRVAPGRLVALAVEDPADAAALMTLLRGEAVPESGSVLLGGRAITDLRIETVRSLLLVADHHVDLFAGTLRSNVDPADRLDPDRLAQVLEASAADDVVVGSAAGLEEHVDADGTALSGGQRQRIALARALAAEAPVLVLHDPTTAVDAVTEHRIAAALHDVRHRGGGGATLVLTSSPALLARADTVVHLRGGRVVRAGAHAELVADDDYRAAVLR